MHGMGVYLTARQQFNDGAVGGGALLHHSASTTSHRFYQDLFDIFLRANKADWG
jgi:hypothetical protein